MTLASTPVFSQIRFIDRGYDARTGKGISLSLTKNSLVLIGGKAIPKTELAIDFDKLGDYCSYFGGGLAGIELFVVGEKNSSGKLASFRVNAQRQLYRVWDFPLQPGLAFCGVTYSPQAGKLFVLGAAGSIWCTSYQAGSPVAPSGLTQFTVIP